MLNLPVYTVTVYFAILAWIIFSIYYIYRLWWLKDLNRYNKHIYDSIPSIFTTLGVLGTFVGIFFGLYNFNVNSIADSIPDLLQGMKTAFSTSIVGIFFALFFSLVSKLVQRNVEKVETETSADEVSALNKISFTLQEILNESNRNALMIQNALIGESDKSISTQFVKVRNQITDALSSQSKQEKLLELVQKSLGGDEDTSLLTQIRKLRDDQNEYSRETRKNVEFIVESMNKNNELVSQKFDEFSELLAKSNTEALVEVMKKATEEFNAQMSELINKLVQENFEELNNSVQRMNQWQQENKEMITTLTDQFKEVSLDFKVTSESLQNITDNTKKLTDENSLLTNLIKELQEVMINDTKFKEITDKISDTVNILKENTEAFDETTNKLNEWVRNQRSFSDSVDKLLVRLEEIDKIKDINELFWKNTKDQLDEGVNIIRRGSELLRNDLDNINDEFYSRLNDTLRNLDNLILRIVENH